MLLADLFEGTTDTGSRYFIEELDLSPGRIIDSKIGNARISYTVYDDYIKLHSIRVSQPNRKKGNAINALRELCAAADTYGYDIFLDASPLDKRTRLDKLVALYRKFGFELTGKTINPVGDPQMVRKAQPPKLNDNSNVISENTNLQQSVNNPALMTLAEYMTFMNPSDKHHSENAYNYTVNSLNNISNFFSNQVMLPSEWKNYSVYSDNNQNYFIRFQDKNVGWVEHGVLYIDKQYYLRGFEDAFAQDLEIKYVKYPEHHFTEMLAAKAKREYPILLQNLLSKGEQFQLRKNEHDDLAILNDLGLIVSIAQNEYGCILVSTTKEYRGYGFGRLLGIRFRELHPDFNTGGVTPNGQKQVVRIWKKYISDAIKNGLYTRMLRAGNITKSRINDILSDYDGAKFTSNINKTTNIAAKIPDDYKNWLVFNYNNSIIVYHRSVYDASPADDDLEKYIVGYLHLEHMSSGIPTLHDIQYVNQRAEKILIYGSLFLTNNKLAIDHEASDFTDSIKTLDDVTINNNMASTTRDLNILSKLFDYEKIIRLKNDPYSEYMYAIQSAAESKWL